MAEQYEVKAVYSADITAFSAGVQTAIASMNNFSRTAEKSTKSVAGSVAGVGKSMMVAGAAATAAGVAGLKSYGDFSKTMNQAAVVAGGTAKDIKGLTHVAEEMGDELPISAKESAEAMLSMARDGASLDQIKQEFPAVARAATAAGADLQATANVVQQSMNIWGASIGTPAQAAADLTQTANLSNASIEDMQQALATIGGTASNAGISMQDTSTAIGLLTNKGFSAAQASQDLNHAILMMQAPSKGAAKQMDALGLSFNDAQGNMKPFPQILAEISEKMDGMSSSEKADALKRMFGTSGMAAILPLMNSIRDETGSTTTSWKAFSNQLQSTTSTAAEANDFLSGQAAEMQKNVGSKLKRLEDNMGSLKNASFDTKAGITGALLDSGNDFVRWATTSNSSVASIGREFVGLLPVLGPVTTYIGLFTKLMGPASAAVTMFTNPIGLSVIALSALVVYLIDVYNKNKEFKKTIDKVGKALSEMFVPYLKAAWKALQDIGPTLGIVLGTIGGGVVTVLAFNKAVSGLATAMDLVAKNKVVAVIIALAIAAQYAYKHSKTFKNIVDTMARGVKVLTDKIRENKDAMDTMKRVVKLLAGSTGLIMLVMAFKKVKSATSGATGLLKSSGKHFEKPGSGAGKSQKSLDKFANTLIKISFSIGIVFASLSLFAFALTGLAKTGNEGAVVIGVFGAAIVGIITAIGLFAPAISVATPGLLALSGLFISIGAAIAIASVGLATLVNAISKLIDTLNNANQAGENAKQLLVSIGEGFAGMIAQFLISLEEAVPQVVQGFIDMLVSVFNIIATNAPTVVGAFTDMIVSLINAISDNLGNILDAGTNLVINLLKGIGTKTNEVINAGVDMVKSILQGITDNLHKLSDTAVDFVNRLVYEIGYAAGRLWGSGSQLLDTVVKGFNDGQSKAKDAGTNASNSVHDGANSVDLFDVGGFLMSGLTNGIGASASNAVIAAVRVAKGILKGVKGALGIHSPSRKMAEVGMFTMMGMQNGIDDNSYRVTDSISNVADEAVKAAQFGTTGFEYSMTPVTSGFDLNDNGTVSMSLENNKQPAQLNLAMGQNTYSAYVDDISNQQGKSYDLRKNNAVSVY
ncbi:phage tail tape measure protein [Fructobacillus durionis]